MPTYDLLLAGTRRDADTSPVADGANHPLLFNAIGRLKTSVMPGALANGAGNLTAATQSVTVDVSRVSNVVVDIVGTFTGLNVTFETSLNGTDWKVEQGVRSNAATIESASGVVASPLAYSWEFSVNAKAQFRVRCTAIASGTASVIVGLGAFATEPFVTVPAHGISGNVAVTNALLATGAAGLGKAEDVAHVTGDVGVMALAVRNDDAAVVGTSANGDYSGVSVDGAGALFTRTKPGGTPAITSVAGATSSTQLLAASASRRGVLVFNESTATLYLAFATSASVTAYSVQIPAGGYYEAPEAFWQSPIFGIWSAANGNARITAVS